MTQKIKHIKLKTCNWHPLSTQKWIEHILCPSNCTLGVE